VATIVWSMALEPSRQAEPFEGSLSRPYPDLKRRFSILRALIFDSRVDAGTPILTPGETAILAFGQVKDAPWVVDGQLAVRKACTLSLSFDHRVADGELGSAVLRDVGAMLEDPVRMLAWS